jgi:hypothetical protein
MGILLWVSLGFIARSTLGTYRAADSHFFFLGLGFLLLETKSIVDCSLYFGATWIVTTIVTAGILLMVLAANALATCVKSFSLSWYIPLLAAVALLGFMPKEYILSWPLPGRMLWVLWVIPLPIFFACLIFFVTLSRSAAPNDRRQ